MDLACCCHYPIHTHCSKNPPYCHLCQLRCPQTPTPHTTASTLTTQLLHQTTITWTPLTTTTDSTATSTTLTTPPRRPKRKRTAYLGYATATSLHIYRIPAHRHRNSTKPPPNLANTPATLIKTLPLIRIPYDTMPRNQTQTERRQRQRQAGSAWSPKDRPVPASNPLQLQHCQANS